MAKSYRTNTFHLAVQKSHLSKYYRLNVTSLFQLLNWNITCLMRFFGFSVSLVYYHCNGRHIYRESRDCRSLFAVWVTNDHVCLWSHSLSWHVKCKMSPEENIYCRSLWSQPLCGPAPVQHANRWHRFFSGRMMLIQLPCIRGTEHWVDISLHTVFVHAWKCLLKHNLQLRKQNLTMHVSKLHKTSILVKSGHILWRKGPLVFPLMSYHCSASTLWFMEVPESNM